jgi:hypothetical protein
VQSILWTLQGARQAVTYQAGIARPWTTGCSGMQGRALADSEADAGGVSVRRALSDRGRACTPREENVLNFSAATGTSPSR